MTKYRPYQTRKQISQRYLRMIALALIVIIVGAVITIKLAEKRNAAENTGPSEVMPIEKVLPESGTQPSAVVPTTERRVAPVQPGAIELLPAKPISAPVAVVSKPIAETVPAPAAVADKPIIETIPAPVVSSAIPVDGGATSPEARSLIEKATQLDDAGQIIAARDLLNHTLDLQLSAEVRGAVKNKLAKLAESWLFSRDVHETDKLTSYYLVQSGDLLATIAKQHKIPYEALMSINNIARPELLQAGQKIKVIDGPFNAVIYKSSFTMDLYLQSVYVKTYRVGLGKTQYETPAGRWRVKKGGKLISPRWTDPDTGKVYVGSAPDYPLGSRWIAIEGLDANTKDRTGFAIHGTKDPESIGVRSSRGCIRLFNGDVIEVYNLLQEGLSEVLVVE